MTTLKFKTNINCGNCIKSVTPFLNQEIDIEHWEVDTENPDKVLTIRGEVTSLQVESIIKEAGFVANVIKE
jgi:copper chaperone CopZ